MLFRLAGLLHLLQRRGIDAVAEAGWGRSVVKDVTEVSVALATQHFSPGQEKTSVALSADALAGCWRMKAGPAGARIELRVRIEENVPAADAAINARLAG